MSKQTQFHTVLLFVADPATFVNSNCDLDLFCLWEQLDNSAFQVLYYYFINIVNIQIDIARL